MHRPQRSQRTRSSAGLDHLWTTDRYPLTRDAGQGSTFANFCTRDSMPDLHRSRCPRLARRFCRAACCSRLSHPNDSRPRRSSTARPTHGCDCWCSPCRGAPSRRCLPQHCSLPSSYELTALARAHDGRGRLVLPLGQRLERATFLCSLASPPPLVMPDAPAWGLATAGSSRPPHKQEPSRARRCGGAGVPQWN